MELLKGKKIYSILIYINYIFILNLMKTCYKIKDFDYIFITVLFLVGVLIYYFYSEILVKKSYKIMFTLVFLISIELVCYSKLKYVNLVINDLYINNFKEIDASVYNSLDTHFAQFKPYFGLIIPITTCILIFLTNKGLKASAIVYNLVFITYFWYLGFVDQVKSALAIYIFLSLVTYSANTYINRINGFMKRGLNIGINYYKVIVCILTVSFVITYIGNTMPQTFEGSIYSEAYGRFKNSFARGSGNIEELSSDTKYSLAISGYDNSEKKLGGPISLDSSVVFKVKSDKIYYLKGSVKDYYDGFSWKETDRKYKKENLLTDKSIIGKVSLNLLGDKKNLTIYPDNNLRTSSFFVPQLSYNISVSGNGVYYNSIPTFMSESEIRKEYTVKFYESTLNEDILNILGNNLENENYKKSFEEYLQVPKNISPAIYRLVNNLVKNCKNDGEKVKKIQEYLRDNYQYTLNVSNVPKGHEFIDYFIFNEKKGYCTYFATAATIFYRIAGIPSRYVEGFNMQDVKDSNGFYIVSNENAHAWSEVLLMKNENSGLWVTVDSVPGVLISSNSINNQNPINEDIEKQEKQDTSNIENVDNGNEEESNIDYQINTTNKHLTRIAITSMVACGILLIFIMIRIIIFKRKRNYILNSNSITPLYVYTNKRLGYANVSKPEHMADMEFAESIKNDELKARMKAIVKAAYQEFYGNKEDKEFNKYKYYDFIEEYVKNRQNIFKYYLRKYIFYK